ncbi:hypothetical protein SDRG_04075 [Saprolegnia diclina VS20]|uniref:Uncharacterized protein n=1 Tax=Saprolegnia diclina (strain VS20) TaxID=1156394 RepID=T0QUJ4_SAPDV|nr:hypothetical protein SDRG_04075 [Saprolegnia diclina VS20]EQC38361.1 hypothetical protein SDRG_04075 [Saprolegnia diclina VS20]|eukprot:XP_008607953.1 hypothetical protein SDRG_04075 [Saprolegnia diclina VS20]
MSLLDLSTDDADDGFGLDVDELEMDIGADIFRPSATLADDSFLKDEFSLDAMSLEPLSFCEFGPFSPPSSPRLRKKDASFTHQEIGGVKPEPATSLPPKYFKTVRSSPQKRRMISRTLGQIKSFSFSTPPPGPIALPPVAATPLTVVTRSPSPKTIRPKKVDEDVVIKEEPIEAEPEPVVTPKRQAARMLLAPTPTASPVSSPLPSSPSPGASASSSMASPLRAAPSSPSTTTPIYIKKEVLEDDAFSPMVKMTNKNVAATWTTLQDMPTLPPRYYRGPDSSPEKKRAHSTTFGRMSTFSFKMPKLDADADDSVNFMKRGATMAPQP